MKKKKLLLSSLLMLMSLGMAHGQTNAYVYVQQSGSVVGDDGIATVDISSTDYELSFSDDGSTAYMKVGDVTVATLPINSTSNGELVANTALPSGYTSETAVVKASVTTAGMATYYSPFRLSVPTSSDVTAYAPTYNSTNHELECTTSTQVNNAIIPAGTALLLKGNTSEAKSITFTIDATGTEHAKGALSGSALVIAKPTATAGNSIYTLGYKGDDKSAAFCFFINNGTTDFLAAKAWLEAGTISAGGNAKIGISFGDEPTAISDVNASTSSAQARDGKYIENGKVVIVKNNKKYNVNGQEVE